MSLVDKTFFSRFKDLLVIENSNNGFDTNIDKIKSGNGIDSAIGLSKNQLKVTPNADSTTTASVLDADGNTLFLVDSTNDYVKALGNHVNTQFREFGLYDFSPTQGYHAPMVVSNMMATNGGDLPVGYAGFGGNGTDPATEIDISTAAAIPKNVLANMWYLQNAITIDEVRVIATCDSSQDLNFHVMGYSLDTSSNHGDLAAGGLVAHINTVISATTATIKTDTLVIDTASLAAGLVVVVFVENEGGTGDITCQATIKYHLT